MGVKYVRRCPRCWDGTNAPRVCSLCLGARFVTVPGGPLPDAVVDVLVEPAVPYKVTRHISDYAEPDAETQPLDVPSKWTPPSADFIDAAQATQERIATALEGIERTFGQLVEWTLASEQRTTANDPVCWWSGDDLEDDEGRKVVLCQWCLDNRAESGPCAAIAKADWRPRRGL